MDRAAFEASLAAEGYEPNDGQMAAGTFNDLHTHPFDARLFILSGEITVEHDGKSSTCRAGDTFSLAADTPHTERVGPEGVTYVSGRRAI